MRDAVLLIGWHLVSADVEAAIYRGGIAGDNFPVESFRECDAQGALAGRGWTDDRDENRTGTRSWSPFL